MTLLKNIGRELGHEPPKPVARAFAPLPARRAPPRPAPAAAPIPRETAQAPRSAPSEPQEEPFGPGYLTRMLDRQDRITDDSRVGSDMVHISGLSDLCIRSYVLADDEQRVLEQRPTGGHRVMWKLGRAAEKHVREGIITDRKRKGVLGRWRCACRASQRDGLWEPATCQDCGTGLDEYRELPIGDEAAGVIGNPDLMIYVGRQILPIEIKSMNAKDWAALESPLPDHLFQGNGYHRLLTTNRFPVMPVVAYIYVTKDFKWGSPYKEYHVEPDAITSRVVSMAWTEATTLKAARESGALPRRVKCAAMTDPRAKKCPVSVPCFLRSSS